MQTYKKDMLQRKTNRPGRKFAMTAEEPLTQRKIQDFYQYNINWKNHVQNKIQKVKTQLKSLQKQQPQSIQKFTSYHVYDKQNYEGPITGWKKHSQNYIEKRTYTEPFTYRPQINKISSEICELRRQKGLKIQQRLSQMGKDQIQKKMDLRFRMENLNKSQKKVSQTHLNKLFNRLYQDSKKINLKRKQKQIIEKRKYKFTPQINKLNQRFQKKIDIIRKPLYRSINQQKHIQSHLTFAKEYTYYQDQYDNNFYQQSKNLQNQQNQKQKYIHENNVIYSSNQNEVQQQSFDNYYLGNTSQLQQESNKNTGRFISINKQIEESELSKKFYALQQKINKLVQ